MAMGLLISIGAVAGLSAFLALVLVIADSTIGNYGTVKITVNEETEFEAKGGAPLLRILDDQGLFIPSACGGRGSCGLCKVRVTEGAGNFLPTELPWLSEEEKAQNIRLSCQLKVKDDLKIQIPEELFSVKEFRARVAGLRDLTHDIKEVTLELIEPETIDIKAGQFIQIKTPEYKLTDEPIYRAYSVASNPADPKKVELEIRLVPGGICTTYVHQHLKEGDEVTFNGPYGDFFLRNTGREILCIAGGSGMAPIKSILLDMEETKNPRKARYFFGARSGRDLFLLDEMSRLESALEDFSFVPGLSEPQEEDRWSGETGLITEIVDRHVAQGIDAEAYLCGSPGMIDAVVKVLTSKGIPEEHIYYDKFG